MLLGAHLARMDSKFRLAVPAKFRQDLTESVVVTAGLDRCLYLLSAEEFTTIVERIRAEAFTNAAARGFLRFLFAYAHHEILDKQGRVAVPLTLRTYAGARDDCIFIGACNRIEIWQFQRWKTYVADPDRDVPGTARVRDLAVG